MACLTLSLQLSHACFKMFLSPSISLKFVVVVVLVSRCYFTQLNNPVFSQHMKSNES